MASNFLKRKVEERAKKQEIERSSPAKSGGAETSNGKASSFLQKKAEESAEKTANLRAQWEADDRSHSSATKAQSSYKVPTSETNTTSSPSYSMTQAEYDMRRASNPTLPEYGSYEYYKSREETLRPIMEQIASDTDRQDEVYKEQVRIYDAGEMPIGGSDAIKEKTIRLSQKFKYQDAVIAEYKDVMNKLNKYEGEGIHYTEEGEFDTSSGTADAEGKRKRYTTYLNTDPLTAEEVRQGGLGNLPKDRQAVYDETKGYVDASATEKEKIDLYEYYDSVKDNQYDDDFWGQSAANYRASDIGINTNIAYGREVQNPTEANEELAEAWAWLLGGFQDKHENALDNEGAVLPWISRDFAGYLPQVVDRLPSQIVGGATGGFAGSFVGQPLKGAALGAGVATTAHVYPQMQGQAYQSLIEIGIDEETARKFATDEAFVSSLIEGGDAALDVLLLGFGSSLSAVGNSAARAVAKGSTNVVTKMIAKLAPSATKATAKAAAKASAPLWKRGVKTGGKLVLNALGEYVEEATQEATSIANLKRAAQGDKEGGVGDLALGATKTTWDAVTGKDKKAREQMHEAGGVGFRVGLLGGGTTMMANKIVTDFFNKETIQEQNEYAYEILRNGKSLDALIEQGKASGEGSVSAKVAKEVESSVKKGRVTRDQVKRLIQAIDVYIQDENSKEAKSKAVNIKSDDSGRRIVSQFLNNKPAEKENPLETARKEAEARATEAAYNAGKANVPMDKAGLATPAQVEAYNAGRMESIKNMGAEKPNQTAAGKKTETVNTESVNPEQHDTIKPDKKDVVEPKQPEVVSAAKKASEQPTKKGVRTKKSDWTSHDVEWTIPNRKTPIAYSTQATSFGIEVMADENPTATISELKDLIHYDVEAKKVLQQYIDAGYGDQIANEWFSTDKEKIRELALAKLQEDKAQTPTVTNSDKSAPENKKSKQNVSKSASENIKTDENSDNHQEDTHSDDTSTADERVLKAAKAIQKSTGMTEEEAIEKASNIWAEIDKRNGKTNPKEEGMENVHEGVLDGESDDDGAVRESELVSEAEEGRNTGTENREHGENVSDKDGTVVQSSESEASGERPNDSRSDNNRVRESDNGDGDHGSGAYGNNNVNDEVKEAKAKDFSITKAVAEEIDTKAPSMDDNINAIKVLQELERSGKAPTKAQQAILAKFKGWGGLSNAFWRDRSRLQEIMSDEEIAAAQSTVNDAYFTPTSIIDSVYKALAHLGFEGGNILEPSMGVGNFFGRLPKAIKDNSSLFGVEIDTISGRIAQLLYPSAKIEISPFQDVAYRDGAFDLIVGNVPFGEVKYKYKGNKYLIHDYFFVKAMDKLNDGGVMAFLTSRGTLDKMDSRTRAELAKQGKLIAAYRLPSSVFSKSASANVVTDLIIMQKTSDTNGERFVNLGSVEIDDMDFSINEYFINHPENIIGKLSCKWNYRSKKYDLDVTDTGNVAEQLTKAIKKLPKGLLNGTQTVGSVDVTENTTPMNNFAVKDDGTVEYIDAQTGDVKQIKGKSADVAKAYIKLKGVYQTLIDSTLSDAEAQVIEGHRKALNAEYDAFVKKYGTLDKNKKLLTADNDYVKLSGLEVYDTKTKSIIKSEMFTKDTLGKRKPKKASSTLDALSISIGETGGVDLERIAELTNLPESEVIKQLDDRIIYTPDGTYELNEVYLSGNVREKYNAVKGKKGFEKNERMLKAVIPEDIPAKNITPQFGSPWIAPKYVADFLKETLHLYGNPTVSYDLTTGTWAISGNTWGDNTLMTHKYGTKYIDAIKLAEKALNMRKIVVKDSEGVVLVAETRAAQQKAEDIKTSFEEWCFKDAGRRQELVAIFNEKFNSHRNMDFSELSKYLTFDGLTETFKLRDYQKRAVARAIFNGNTLLAHGVGTGKTAEMIAIAMELKRMGMAKKNMMVVPPHKVADFRNDILKMYPSAKVIMLEKGANASQRQRFYAQVAANDFDIVVIPHSSFGMLDVSADTKTAFISNQLAELEEVMTTAQREQGKNVDGRFIRQLENQKKRLEEKLKSITESAKDSGNTFEELGIDSLFVDEAHNFKNLPFYSKLSRVAGVSVNQTNNKTRASRAENMFMITDYLNRNNGRITFGTATPITNSMSEIYNMTRFLRPDILEEAGIQSFDAWASMFGSIVNQAEVDPSGRKFRMKERFSKFKNVSQMVEMFRRMADILKTGDVIQELPKAERIDVINEPNDIQEEFLDIVDQMIDEIRVSGQNAQHNMLEVTTAGQMAAVDLRFVESYFKGKYTREDLNIPNNRISRVAEMVVKEYNNSNDRKGTQFVFCDVGVSDDPSKKYNLHVYGDLINRLVAGGIPREEIAIAQDFEDKADLSAKVNTGEIRVLIGSTAVMGEGMNAQNKAVALHHMTVPARPSDIEQREGRIIRFGNENKDVRIYRYIQEKSYDSYQWQMQERKAAFINQALSGGTVEELEEMSDFQLTAREAKAIASGNPLLLEKIEIEDKLNKLKSLRNKFNTDKLEMKDRLAMLPNRMGKLEKTIADTKTDLQTIEAQPKDFEITFGKTKFTERAEAAKALGKAVAQASRNGTRVLVGRYKGLEIYYSSSLGNGTQYILKGAKEYVIEGGESALGNITRIINAIEKIPINLANDEAMLKNYKSEIQTLNKEVTAEFPQAKELEELQAKLNEIDTQLGINVSEVDMSEVVIDESDDDADLFREGDAEPSSMWTTKRVGENKKPKSISEIIAGIEHEFGINVTTGHVRGQGVLGQYDRNSHGIRTRIANNLPVVSHELGHYFERTFDIKAQLTDKMVDELTSQLDEINKDKYNEEQLVREGVAEFVRRYLQNRETAAIDYPLFTDFFLKCFTPKDLAKFQQLADDINAYYSLDAGTATSSIRLREEGGIDLRTPVEKLEDTANALYQAWVDSNHAIRRFDRATGSNAYILASNAAYSDAIAGQIITSDLTDMNGQYVAPGLKTVLHGIDLNNKEEYRLFGEYLVVKHGPERLREGMRVFADDRKNNTAFMVRRQAELESKYPQFEKVSERIYEFIQKFYKTWGVETGLITQEMLDAWGERWKYYVPFDRAVAKEKSAVGAKRGFANQNSTIKKAKGGGQDIYNPVDNLINNIVKMVNAGARNNVARAIAISAESLGANATFLERVPMPLSVTRMDMTGVKEKLTDWLEESDLDDKSKTKAQGVVNNLDDVLYQYGRGKANGNVITVMIDGEPQAWKVNDPLLLESLTSLSPKTMDGILDAYAVVSRFMTANITGDNIIWSIFSNLPVDLGTFFTYSKNKNVAQMAKGVGLAYLNKVKSDNADPLYKEFLAMGGGKISVYTADRDLTKKIRKKLARKTSKNLRGKIDMNPLDWIGFASDTVEAGPRFATYKMMREAGMTPQEAFYEAMDITTNFRRSGRLAKEVNKFAPFFNASVQGLDKFRRWITAEELAGKPERKKAIISRTTMFVAVSATLAAINHVINNSDEEKEKDYEQLSTYTKNSYWVFPRGDGKYFAMTKPREIGVLSSFFERCLEYGIGENDHAFDEFYTYASENFLPPIANEIAQLPTNGVKETGMNIIGDMGIIGVFGYMGANRDFLGRPIVASGLQNLEPKDQYTDRTSKIAYKLGQTFNGSPEEIDFFFQQVLGGWWKYQKALFPVGEKNRDLTLGVANTYIKDNQYSTDLTNWLYDRADTTERAKNSNPNNIAKKIAAKWDSNMTDFYGTYYKKAKTDSKSTSARGTRQLVLDMIREYQKSIDGGYKTSWQKAVEAVCKAKGSTDYLPSVMSGEVTDGNGKKHNLSDVQYVEFQTDYLRLYWETVEDTMSADMTTDEKTRILLSAKRVARERAIERTLKRIGASSSEFATKYSGVDNDALTEFLAGVDAAGEDNSVKKSEVVDIISNMNIDNDDAWTLYLSKYDNETAREAEKYGIDANLFMTATVDMSNIKADYYPNGKVVSGSRRRKIESYLNSVCNSYKEYLFLLGMEYESIKDDQDYLIYFGE